MLCNSGLVNLTCVLLYSGAFYISNICKYACIDRKKITNRDFVKGGWMKEEEVQILELVNKYGAKKWFVIAMSRKVRLLA